ncbi:hypothetical protein SIM91_43550 [Rhodococcus opacus]|uniref:hypothetical protein n=1 Tax=Rhodococcus opacus TaxID=37919 RepID=UPI0002F48FCF|nr:hypothetical protein [Rhodococcus opacus]MDX5970038.1 hypothetical protein [Rhodococcus opacus]CAG7634532.1 hypothetical protein E143388_07614 [Rhodococcus opacus]
MVSATGNIRRRHGAGEHPRRRRRPRGAVAVVSLIGLCLTVAGCSAGQNTQTSSQVAAVNGANIDIGDIALRNVYLAVDPPPTSEDAPRPDAALAFTAINTSDTAEDRLVSIDTPAANSVDIDADPATLVLQPQTALAAGQPIEQLEEPAAPDRPITVTVDLIDSRVRPGLTIPMTFTFDKAGSQTFRVPFDMWASGDPRLVIR